MTTQEEVKSTVQDNRIIDSFLMRRGLSSDDVDYLVNPNANHQHNPFLLRGVHDWIDTLHALKGEPIAIAPDYDADGVLSGTVARVGLSLFGFGDAYVYPPKTRDGYGLTRKTVDNILNAQPETRVIVTTDNGSNAHEGIAYAKSKGLMVLVTDHHLANSNPLADASVNPNVRGQETYPFKEISGTTVIYKTLLAYGLKYYPNSQALRDFHSLILLVGISTISDVMPLLNENRYYVTQAVSMLQYFEQGHSMERLLQYGDTPLEQYYRGVDLLVATLHKYGKLKYGINSDTFGFTIGPMLNSPRRMVGESELGFDLFQTTKDDLLSGQIEPPSDVLYEMNENRKAYVKRLTRGLYARIEHSKHVEPIYFSVFNAVTGAGIAGLLANSYTKKYKLPSIAFSVPMDNTQVVAQDIDPIHLINTDTNGREGHISGSGRSPESFDLHAFLASIDEAYPDLIHKWGGHAQAAGITIKAENFERFRQVYVSRLLEILAEQEAQEQTSVDTSVLTLPIDGEYIITTPTYDELRQTYAVPESCEEIRAGVHAPIMANQSLLESVRFFEQLEPFGHGFPKPSFSVVFRMTDVEVVFMGKDNQHAKVILPNKLSVIHWNGADAFAYNGIGKDTRLFLVTGELSINSFNGRESLQLVVEDLTEFTG